MSAHYSNYSNTDGKSAFLSGAVSALADAYLCKALPKYWALETDVFEAGTSDLCGCIRKRLKDYLSDPDADIADKTDVLDFNLQPLSEEPDQIIHDLFDRYKAGHVPDESDLIKSFLSDVRYQLREPKGIYRVEGALTEEITDVLSGFYTYVIFEILFIEYNGFIVMLVFGSDE